MTKRILPEGSSPVAEKQIEILIAGVVRDCRKTIGPSIKQLQDLFGSSFNLSYFLVESDSTDGTKLALEQLATRHPRFNYKSLGDLAPQIPDRIRRIAHCRNQYLSHLQGQLAMGARIEYLVVADFDGVNLRIHFPEPKVTLVSAGTIVATNQNGFYYDILALRASNWVEEDYRISLAKAPNGNDPLSNSLKFVSSKQRKISKSEPPIKVTSAFGGLAIYPVPLLDGCWYEPKQLSQDIWECEHVGFNACALRNGGQMIILPNLRNRGSLGHTLFAHRFPRCALQILIKLGVPSLFRKIKRKLDGPRVKIIR